MRQTHFTFISPSNNTYFVTPPLPDPLLGPNSRSTLADVNTAWLTPTGHPGQTGLGPEFANEAAALSFIVNGNAPSQFTHWIWFDQSDNTLKHSNYNPPRLGTLRRRFAGAGTVEDLVNNDNFSGPTSWLSAQASPSDGPANYADEAAAVAFLIANFANNAANFNWIWYDESDGFLKKGPFVAHIPEVQPDPLSVDVDVPGRTVTINYAPLVEGLVTAVDTFGDIDTLLEAFFHRVVAHRVFRHRCCRTLLTRTPPFDIDFSGGVDQTIELDGLAGGPDQNVFTGTDKAAAVVALEAYATLNPSWRNAYLADQRLFVSLRWGSAGEGTIYILREDGVWQDMGLVVLRGDQGLAGPTGTKGDQGNDGADGAAGADGTAGTDGTDGTNGWN